MFVRGAKALASTVPILWVQHSGHSVMMESADSGSRESFVAQPSFLWTTNMRRSQEKTKKVSLDSMALISGSAHKQLAKDISDIVGVPLLKVDLSRFADGEVNVQIKESIGGKNVFIVQSCAAPVNDSILELLLTVSCCRRAGADRVIAVIPYYGYKHHRRGSSISTKHKSRFLTSVATDFSIMLQEMGVDSVIAVDLQRPGQGHEACFFNNNVPLETVITTELMIDHVSKTLPLQKPIVVVSPNSECVKKARTFQNGFRKAFKDPNVKLAAFIKDNSSLKLLGNPQIEGADVVIVDDMIDTANSLREISQFLQHRGARNIYLCASHGLFADSSIDLIETDVVKKIIVTDTLPKPLRTSPKIEQVSVAPMLARLILAEHFRELDTRVAESFEVDN